MLESLGLSTQSLLEQFSRRTIATYDLLPNNSNSETRNQQTMDLRGNPVMGKVSPFFTRPLQDILETGLMSSIGRLLGLGLDYRISSARGICDIRHRFTA